MERFNLSDGEHSSGIAFGIPLPGNQCRTEGAHDSGDVRADGFTVRDFFKTAQDGIVVEGTALDHDMLSEFGGIRHFNNLEQGVFNDRIGKSRRDIRYFRTFFLRLLYFGIHEYGAAGPQINGMSGE